MKPILRDFPDSFDTERLTIRAPRAGDGAEMNAAVRDSWSELQEWMPWAAGDPPAVEEHEARLREARARFLLREDMWLLLFLKGTDTLAGSSGLHRINWNVPSLEIGYWVRTPYGRQGYITEAVKGITNFAFDLLGARRVEIRCDSLNERSAAVARRSGYELEATLHNHDRHHRSNRLRDTLVFVRTAPD
ncbi:MAG TPA: GNAT family N-acetyltransferase [Candidatus Sulfomarinibacteraceae bacterium]|nr:GNAT family N-acetyltransferase [Candidatus Sulfomarinibacteraceae bacterium]